MSSDEDLMATCVVVLACTSMAECAVRATASDTAAKTVKDPAGATVKDATQATARVTTASSGKDLSQATAKDTSQAIVKDTSQVTVKGTSQATVKDTSQVTVKDTSQATVKDTSQATVKDTSQATVEDASQATVRDASQATVKLLSNTTGATYKRKRRAKHSADADVKTGSGRRRKKQWCDEFYLEREKTPRSTDILKELRTGPNSWFKILRMDEETYLELLSRVTPFIKKKDTVMRAAITPHERLTATLMFLTTGKNLEEIKLMTRVSGQALGNIIRETCKVILTVIGEQYLKLPETEEDWEAVAEDFWSTCHFPHCVGAVGGKHVEISPPTGNSTFYQNHEGRRSVVLIAVANAKYEFTFCDAGTNGAISNGRSFQRTTFYNSLANESLNLPPEAQLANSDRKLPFVFVCDDVFPMLPNMLKRYSFLESSEQTVFNYRLDRALRVVENTLGIMSTRFGLFNSRIHLKSENVELVVQACCVLHNFMMQSSASYAPPECFDKEDLNTGSLYEGLRTRDSRMIDLATGFGENPDELPNSVRNDFTDYFANEGKLPGDERFFCVQ